MKGSVKGQFCNSRYSRILPIIANYDLLNNLVLQTTTYFCSQFAEVSILALRWRSSAGLHAERLQQPSCTALHLGPGPKNLTPWLKQRQSPGHFLSWISWVLHFFFLLSLHPFPGHIQIFESSQLKGSYVGALLYSLPHLYLQHNITHPSGTPHTFS